MSFPIRFYNFSKKINSTARPETYSGTVYQCNLIDSCSIINPRVAIVGGNNAFNPRTYNYMFIEEFDRHYYINDWTYDSGVWIASAKEDVLASWKITIGNSTQYVSRSASNKSDLITDVKFPALVTPTSSNAGSVESVFVSNVSRGCVIVTVPSISTDVTPETVYAFTVGNFRTFYNNVLQPNLWEQLVQWGVSPFELVSKCFWLPIEYERISGVERDKVTFPGSRDVSCTCKHVTNLVVPISLTFNIDNHPQISTINKAMNCEPYTRRTLIWPYIGRIPIESSRVSNINPDTGKPTIYLSMRLDLNTSRTYYTISGYDHPYVFDGDFEMGVALSLTSIKNVDVLTAIESVVGLAAVAGTGPLGGNALVALSAVETGISSTRQEIFRKGSTASFSYTAYLPIIHSDFYNVPNYNSNKFGYPLFAERKINQLSGYIEVNHAVVEIPATDGEINDIISFMEGGFYYE